MYPLRFLIAFCLLTFLPLFSEFPAAARVKPGIYGVPAPTDSVQMAIAARTTAAWDSLLKAHPQAGITRTFSAVSDSRPFGDSTTAFYLVLLLVLLLGLIRLADPRYFHTIWQAFINPTQANRQLKDKLQGASIPNLMMNVFFTMSAAAYVFFVVRNFTPSRTSGLDPSILLLLLVGGMMAIYAGKYVVIRFSGWAFRVQGITEHYLFNVFLVNKILSVVLLPFVILLAFAAPDVAQPALFISFLLILSLFINRYVRSWQVFGSFFQYSKFHFFTYLCASELLPLAVLMKLLVRGLLY